MTPDTGARPGPRTRCRFCRAPLTQTFADLGMSPLCESYVTADRLDQMEPFFPLHVRVCSRCFLVQLGEYVSPAEIFSEYAYFSSYSESWVRHAKSYADRMTELLHLGSESRVVEVASNDGYLLQHFVAKGIPVLGIEPARNVAARAIERGIPTIERFFGPARGHYDPHACEQGSAADERRAGTERGAAVLEDSRGLGHSAGA